MAESHGDRVEWATPPEWVAPSAVVNDYRTLWLAANESQRRMFAWFVFAAVQALCWMGVALWALTK